MRRMDRGKHVQLYLLRQIKLFLDSSYTTLLYFTTIAVANM
jgi:hypothetical protein